MLEKMKNISGGRKSGEKILIFSLPVKKRKEVMGKCSKVEAHLKKTPREALFLCIDRGEMEVYTGL